jgi:hypothetical protein
MLGVAERGDAASEIAAARRTADNRRELQDAMVFVSFWYGERKEI